jgi:DNA-binding NtrC family response regulator
MRSRRVLIAYQDEGWVRSLASFFQEAGYRVEIARVVSDVLRRVRSGAAQVLLLDDEVEGVRACDLVSLLKGINGGVQVIVISAGGSLDLVRRLRGAGIFYQAMKPVDMEELKSAVECAFDKIDREESGKFGFWSFLVPGRVPA